jgi:hypothetical protein
MVGCEEELAEAREEPFEASAARDFPAGIVEVS